jgi:hypothetical protein
MVALESYLVGKLNAEFLCGRIKDFSRGVFNASRAKASIRREVDQLSYHEHRSNDARRYSHADPVRRCEM